jgi:hypothetical protein
MPYAPNGVTGNKKKKFYSVCYIICGIFSCFITSLFTLPSENLSPSFLVRSTSACINFLLVCSYFPCYFIKGS